MSSGSRRTRAPSVFAFATAASQSATRKYTLHAGSIAPRSFPIAVIPPAGPRPFPELRIGLGAPLLPLDRPSEKARVKVARRVRVGRRELGPAERAGLVLDDLSHR